jgi:hypothetical protein
METRTSRPRETWEQAVNRLALQAQETGVKIFVHDLGTRVEFFATSVGRPGTLHRVTLFSCDCAGFVRHQRCSHVAALLAEVGELPPLPPTPTPAEMVERRAEQVTAQAAVHVEEQARKWLTSLIERQERGEVVPQADVDEATTMVATYAAIASPPVPVALAA